MEIQIKRNGRGVVVDPHKYGNKGIGIGRWCESVRVGLPPSSVWRYWKTIEG
jgi:hypothetical protein